MKRSVLVVTIITLLCTHTAFGASNFYDSFWSGYNNIREDRSRDEQMDYQRRKIQIEEERLQMERDRHQTQQDSIRRQEQKITDAKNLKIWATFLEQNPKFTENSIYRKHGDHLFDSIYREKVLSGKMTYAEALNKVAEETYSAIDNIQSSVKTTVFNHK